MNTLCKSARGLLAAALLPLFASSARALDTVTQTAQTGAANATVSPTLPDSVAMAGGMTPILVLVALVVILAAVFLYWSVVFKKRGFRHRNTSYPSTHVDSQRQPTRVL